MLATWRQAVPKHVVLGDNFCSLVFHHFTSFIMWGQTEYFHLLRFPPGTKPFVEGIFVTKKSSLHRLDLQAQEIDFLKKQLEVNPQSERHRNLVGLGCNTWKSAWKPCHQQRGIFGLRFFVEKGNRRKKVCRHMKSYIGCLIYWWHIILDGVRVGLRYYHLNIIQLPGVSYQRSALARGACCMDPQLSEPCLGRHFSGLGARDWLGGRNINKQTFPPKSATNDLSSMNVLVYKKEVIFLWSMIVARVTSCDIRTWLFQVLILSTKKKGWIWIPGLQSRPFKEHLCRRIISLCFRPFPLTARFFPWYRIDLQLISQPRTTNHFEAAKSEISRLAEALWKERERKGCDFVNDNLISWGQAKTL